MLLWTGYNYFGRYAGEVLKGWFLVCSVHMLAYSVLITESKKTRVICACPVQYQRTGYYFTCCLFALWSFRWAALKNAHVIWCYTRKYYNIAVESKNEIIWIRNCCTELRCKNNVKFNIHTVRIFNYLHACILYN